MSFASRIRSLASDAAVYGIANVLGRFLTFLLVPLYTNFLSPEEYGPVATLYSYIALANVLLLLGLDSAYLRLAAPDQGREARHVFSTATLLLAAIALAATGAAALAAGPLAAAAGLPGEARFVRAAAGVLALDVLAAIPLAALRIERRPGAFAAARLGSIAINVALTVWLLAGRGHGAFAILEANLVSSAALVLLLLPVYERLLRPAPSRGLARELLRFGLPLVPSGLAALAVQVADRPILQHLLGAHAVGVYQANHKLGILMMLFVTVFQFAWQPFFLLRAGDPDARPLFARVLTYYLAAAMGVFLAVTLLVDRIVALPLGGGRTLIDRAYWGGTNVVPWVLLGYVALGVYTNLSAGPTLAKRTGLFPWVTGIAAVVNVGANLVLVPRAGIVGSAWAALLAYAAMAAGMALAARTVYPVPYEVGRLARIAAAGLLAWGAFVALGGAALPLAPRLLLLAAYPAALVLSGFLAPGERAALRRALVRGGRAT